MVNQGTVSSCLQKNIDISCPGKHPEVQIAIKEVPVIVNHHEHIRLGLLSVRGIDYRATIFLQPGQTGFYFDDKQAWSGLSRKQQLSGFPLAPAITPGFTNVREPGESVTITLCLEGSSGSHTLLGSCAAIQYAGSGGRKKRFCAAMVLKELKNFDFSAALQAIADAPHVATIRACITQQNSPVRAYGLGQVFLQFAAFASGQSVPEFTARYVLSHPLCTDILRDHLQSIILKTARPEALVDLPLFFQTGDNRTSMVEELLGNAKYLSLAAYPHGLFNSRDKLETVSHYLKLWTQYERDICGTINAHSFLHCDTYGQIAELINDGKVTSCDKRLIHKVGTWILKAAKHSEKIIRIEGAIEIKSADNNLPDGREKTCLREEQIKANAQLLTYLYKKGYTGQIVSDEYVNSIADMAEFIGEIKQICQEDRLDTGAVLKHYMIQIKTPVLDDFTQIIDAIMYCASEGVSVYVGGTCNETTISAHHVYTIAAVLKPAITQVLIRPGMDVRMSLLSYADWQNDFIREYLLRAAPQHETSAPKVPQA